MNITECSKFLSFILRHKPESIGIKLDKAGWVGTSELLEKSRASGKNLQYDTLLKVVAENNKKRFEFSPDKKMIRASQGHSVLVDLGYEESVPPEHLYHGTVSQFIESIFKNGLKKMSRHHVHLSEQIDTARKVAERRGQPIILEIDSKVMYNDGYKFYKSTNGVWLTEYVHPNYIK
jgi:putative RNA 2'-phosphotransferase